jgi:hypothetical protein
MYTLSLHDALPISVYEREEAASPTKFKRLSTGLSYTVNIKLQYREQCFPIKITNSTPPMEVELPSRVMLALGVELNGAKPIIWVQGRVYKLTKILNTRGSEAQTRAQARVSVRDTRNVRVKMTMRYRAVHVTLQHIVIPITAAARDVVNARWEAVDRKNVTDPNITCL